MIRKTSLGVLSLVISIAVAGCANDAPTSGAPAEYLPKPMLAKRDVVAVRDTEGDPVTDDDLAPVVDHEFVGITSPAGVTMMMRQTPLAADITVSAVIGPDGGVLRLPEAGLRLIVPKDAVSVPTTFSVTAVAGPLVAYEFEPHGTTFAVPLILQQKLFNSSTDGVDPNTYHFEAGHFLGRADIDAAGGSGTVDELLPTRIDTAKGRLKFSVRHFSGYLLASGRLRGDA